MILMVLVFSLFIFFWFLYFDWMMILLCIFFSDDVREKGFSIILDMRGSTWQNVKPILKALQVTRILHLKQIFYTYCQVIPRQKSSTSILAAILDFGRHVDFHFGVPIINEMFGFNL